MAKASVAAPVKEKKKMLRARGVLSESSRKVRIPTALVLCVACFSLTFTQLGFVGIGFDGEYAGYAVMLLMPIALAALLLGILGGTAVGFFAGVVLFAHSVLLPLDFYEMQFIDVISSIGFLTVAGLTLGILFAFALRNNPSRAKRAVYIAIVCVVVSLLFTFSFVVNAFLILVASVADSMQSSMSTLSDSEMESVVRLESLQTLFRLGDIGLQAIVDALGMALVCWIGDAAVRRLTGIQKRLSLRPVFGLWLSVVFLISFMATAAVGFVAITLGETDAAKIDMYDELDYLCTQINRESERIEPIIDLLAKQGATLGDMSDDERGKLMQSIASFNLLDGYSKDSDGTIIITDDDFVIMSDDDRIKAGDEVAKYFDGEIIAAIQESVDSGDLMRIIYDDRFDLVEFGSQDELMASSNGVVSTYIAYLLAETARSGEVVVLIRPSDMVFAGRDAVMLWTTLSTIAMLLVVIILVGHLLETVVIRRIQETNGVLERITQGDLKARVEVHEPTEFDSLSKGINDTVVALKGWIAEAETRMDAELATAKAIQESALPRTFPPYPDIGRFDIYASMQAAREVGGDFYDFFLMGEGPDDKAGKLGFVIADVSGKGVPAALFMMQAMTLIREYMLSGLELGEAIENANRQVCDGNDSGMFVTAFVGVLDYGTGHIDFVNAGHNPPLLWKTKEWCWVKEKSGLPLGLFDGLPYEAFSLECEIGDQLLMYTDGVTEAMSVDEELFGEDRLEKVAQENLAAHPRALVEAVRHGVALHSEGAEQSDDITIMALEYGVPPEITATLLVPAVVAELPRVNEFIHTELNRRLCPQRTQNQLDIAVEELFVNVANYAYPQATPENPGIARVSYTYSAEPPSIKVDIADDGIPYNPLAKPDAVTPSDIMEVPIGGLGILMAKKSVDEMSYERSGDSNIVSIVKRW